MSSMPKDMQEKFDKYWSDYNILLSCAAILDPCFKLERVEYCYEKLYGETYAKEMVSRIKVTLFDLFDEYKRVACGATSPTFASSFGMTNVSHDVGCDENQMDDILEYKMFLSKTRKVENDKSELDLYLEEKNFDVMGKCDVLEYWNRSLYGKKLINPWRASLEEKIIEMLACYEDWLRAKGLTLGSTSLFNYDDSIVGEEDEDENEVEEDSFILEQKLLSGGCFTVKELWMFLIKNWDV
ncbi:protein of unknown function DUF4413 [Cynara cardunculus var. scolymus]|uniref:hAT-like transposase RNase-H fold domain-containing protein n=1 Tax=Cynara cardunculus var. scolymus TaxID=59895 RepID=A0A124RAX7_CYNCS|nr:protein of unknown function DUF4413 [Cynara cardunculus var. scolymus]